MAAVPVSEALKRIKPSATIAVSAKARDAGAAAAILPTLTGPEAAQVLNDRRMEAP